MSRLEALKRWRPGLAAWTALIFVVIAGAAVVLYDHHKLKAWAPNIATSAASIAITVTVVNSIVRSDARRRVRPRVDGALQWMGRSFQTFMGLVVLDYGSTHVATFKPIPTTAPEMLALSAAEWDTNDWASGEYLHLIIMDAQRFAGELEQTRARDFDVLEPDLVRAIDEFALHIRQANNVYQALKAVTAQGSEQREREALRRVLQEVHHFSLVLQRYTPDAMTIDESQRSLNYIREQER